MPDLPEPQEKEFVGLIWLDERPGIRISVWAHNAEEAVRKVEAEYGAGHHFSIRNLDDAKKPR